jgi:hypothetical protein
VGGAWTGAASTVVAEAALAHASGNAVARAYQGSDLLDSRAGGSVIADRWVDGCRPPILLETNQGVSP